MDWHAQLEQLCRQWHALSQAEARAIRAEKWDQLEAHQQRKRELQAQFEAVLAAGPGLETPLTSELLGPDLYGDLRQLLSEERENAAAVSDKLHAVRTKLGELDEVQRTLSRVHQAYVPGRPHAWQSFS